MSAADTPPPLRVVYSNPAPEKLLPQNLEAEAGVLGSLLIDTASIVQVEGFLIADDFYREAHQAIYTAIIDLYRNQIPADLITLGDELSRRGRLEDCGGLAYISELCNQVPTSLNILHYARIVKRCAKNRALIIAAGQIAAVAYNEPETAVAQQQAKKLIAEVTEGEIEEAPRFTFKTDTEVENMAPPQWLIAGHLVENTISVVYGEYGSAKSFLALDWALCIGTETPWLGHSVKRGVVAYIAGEGIGGMGKRIRAWKSHHKWSGASDLYLLGEPPQLLQDNDVSALLASLRALPESPALVVIDTLARSLVGGDENSAQDMGVAIQNAEIIRREFGCHVLIVHHTPWDAKRPRGSSALPGATYTNIAVAKEDNAVTIHCAKQKDFEQFADLSLILHTIALDDHADETSCVLIPPDATHSVVRPHRKPQTPKSEQAIIDYLRQHSGMASFGDLVSALPFSRSGVHLGLKGLIEQGIVENRFGDYCLIESS